jgi:hypothetical protein
MWLCAGRRSLMDLGVFEVWKEDVGGWFQTVVKEVEGEK